LFTNSLPLSDWILSGFPQKVKNVLRASSIYFGSLEGETVDQINFEK